ncbi:hypothetical protein HMN09_01078000 [Mycena chlorophos]|uniref:Uncharacterized protein n=1 Tax=Mycena chlorophos TaxID=658473 RepID=A0A8H6SBW0_MYCCL|nr:hypothetical protein HMN09_01078000 [Mycena chlorophos]
MASFLRHALRRVSRRGTSTSSTTASLAYVEPFPELPADIQREIFETTVAVHREMGPVLARVARCVKGWVEPLLYNTLELQPSSVPRLLAALQSKAPTFLQTNVHHLRLYGSIPASVLQLVTERCSSVSDLCMLGLFSSPGHAAILAPYLAALPLRRLSANEAFISAVFTQEHLPKYASLTHLDALPHLNASGIDWPAVLPFLPALTHLRVWYMHSTDAHHDLLAAMLAGLPALKVLMLVCDENTPPDAARRFLCIADVRLVLVQLDGTVETLRTAGAVPPAARLWLEDPGEEHGGPYRSPTLAETLHSPAWSDYTLPDTSAKQTSWMADVLAALDPNTRFKASPKSADVLDLTLSPSLPEGWKPVLPMSVRVGKEKGGKAPQLPELAFDFGVRKGEDVDEEGLFAEIGA